MKVTHPGCTLLALVLTTACGDSQAPSGPDPNEPTAIVIHDGDDQVASTGRQVANPPRVKVTNANNLGVTGIAVTFSVTGGSGSVSFAQANTDAEGIATSGAWILGPPGPQRLTATVESVGQVTFTATALGPPANVAPVTSQSQEAEVASPTPAPPEVLVTDSAGRALPGIDVLWEAQGGSSVSNSSVTTNVTGRAGAGSWTMGEVAGLYALRATLPDSGVTGNPITFQALARPAAPSQITVETGNNQSSEVSVPVAIAPQIKVGDRFGNGIAGVGVRFAVSAGGGTVTGADITTDSAGLASPGRWFLGPVEGATNSLTATVVDGPLAGATTTVTAIATAAVFDIHFHFGNADKISQAHRDVFAGAEKFWESAIRGNLPAIDMNKEELADCLETVDFDIEVSEDRFVDDLLIFVSVYSIDGPGGILGFAGPCFIRSASSLPIVGILAMDVADATSLTEKGHFEGTVIHEMAHVLGFGTVWESLALLVDPVKPPRTGLEDPHFIGNAAIKAFDEAGGTGYDGGHKVPVENLGGAGAYNGHWRDSVLREELMTPWITSGVHNPLSAITLASLQDMGYTKVDFSVAEAFRLQIGGGRPDVNDSSARIYIGNDIARIPIGVVDQSGAVLRYLRPGR